MKLPRLSVVMPTHNALPFLEESIHSIVNQTFSDFEFVILDDCSTDGSDAVLREWAKRDTRIVVMKSERKLGLSGSSNAVVLNAGAPIVARMDADDISHPERLERQLKILQSSPEVAAVGALADGINASGRTVRPRDRWRLVRRSPYIPFPHGSSMFRRAAFQAVGGYSERFTSGEDQDFFFRMTAVGRVVTLPDVLYHFRYHAGNTTFAIGDAGVRVVTDRYAENGADLAGFYLLGAMRLWAGKPLNILPQLATQKFLKFNLRTLMALTSASLGTVSPHSLRFFLRSLIRSRDFLAGLRIKDGRAYEWRLK